MRRDVQVDQIDTAADVCNFRQEGVEEGDAVVRLVGACASVCGACGGGAHMFVGIDGRHVDLLSRASGGFGGGHVKRLGELLDKRNGVRVEPGGGDVSHDGGGRAVGSAVVGGPVGVGTTSVAGGRLTLFVAAFVLTVGELFAPASTV